MESTQAKTAEATYLERILHKEIPATQALALSVSSLTQGFIRLQAPVEHTNINIHGTAFAGSIYSISAVAAWGLVFHNLHAAKAEADVVIARGEISYRKPIIEGIVAETNLSKIQSEKFLDDLRNIGKAELTLKVLMSEKKTLCATNTVKLIAIKS